MYYFVTLFVFLYIIMYMYIVYHLYSTDICILGTSTALSNKLVLPYSFLPLESGGKGYREVTEYILMMVFLVSDWLYFSWHGIHIII